MDSPVLDSVLREAAQRGGLDAAGARLIHHYSNAVYHLPAEELVVRITPGADAGRRARLAHEIVGWLVEHHGFPATAPAPGLGPVQVGDTTVSFWRYYPQPADGPPLTSAHLGKIIQRLHHIAQPAPVQLDRWVPLVSLHEALTEPDINTALADDERHWLLDEIVYVRQELDALDWSLGHGLIHGDAWAGNLLWSGPESDRAILADWDWISHGPREIDLIPTWHAARRYGRGPQWTRGFIDRYGYDLASWPGFPTLMRMRDLVQLTGPLRRALTSAPHARALRQRIDGIRAGDSGVWGML